MSRRAISRERGAFAVAFAIFMIAIIGFISLSMDLAQVYVRETEMQGAADAAAIAAARELDGTVKGIDDANTKAKDVIEKNNYQYWEPINWRPDAMSLGTTADGPWIPFSAAQGDPGNLRYVRIDTSALDPDPGLVPMIFNAGNSVAVRKVAVAGPTSLNVIPLAVCALKTEPRTNRKNVPSDPNYDELLEFGFRRGVTYNLLDLNPDSATPRSFVINPVDFPGAPNRSNHFDRSIVGPFTCTGTMLMPPSRTVYVREPFPSNLIEELNSRFGDYPNGRCKPAAAIADRNVREFRGGTPNFWMVSDWGHVPAIPASLTGQRITVADTPAPQQADRARDYGTLWAYGRPVRYVPTSPGFVGPKFSRNDWGKLYPAADGNPASNYSDGQQPPYISLWTVPPPPSLKYRRILGVPLIDCSTVMSGRATVLAIGKFMLSERATNTPGAPVIPAEFGGVLEEWGTATSAGIYQ